MNRQKITACFSTALTVSSDLLDKSKKALDIILSDSSELYELWKETDDFENWKNEVESLRERLK